MSTNYKLNRYEFDERSTIPMQISIFDVPEQLELINDNGPLTRTAFNIYTRQPNPLSSMRQTFRDIENRHSIGLVKRVDESKLNYRRPPPPQIDPTPSRVSSANVSFGLSQSNGVRSHTPHPPANQTIKCKQIIRPPRQLAN